ncbi:MAG TPA: HEAT repeat domain-containing protein, partial [Coriobacteriia bacterium]|nr:HEAT repeat domain-containing protein [Coriobacteriia bacterium]
VAFLSLLNYSPQAAQAAGGFERRLWERGVTSITVTHRPPDAPTSPPAGSDEPVASVPARMLSAEEVEELVERLAEESDPEVRRTIVADVSEVAGHYVPELSTHLSDPRWYVVRNVVSILGAARSTDVLPLMERALRHQEPRVRREAVRTVAGIGGLSGARVLARALQDEDAQTVQLAARSLGETGAVEAVDALAQVAQGDGEGNRDTGPRVEAIEALGRIGSPKALPALKSVASRRSLWGGARTRGLRTAAESAIVQITGRDTPT